MHRFSIVVPVYFNEENLQETVSRLLALESLLVGFEIELIFVDDGSQDASLPMLLEWQRKYPRQIQVLSLSRNFGSMSALLAGLTVAKGDCVGVIAADLQDPPELFVEMLEHWKRGCKSVLAVRADRDESATQRFFASAYYKLVRKLALPGYPEGGFDFFLIDRQVQKIIVEIGEKNSHMFNLLFWLGFSPVMIPYTRRARDKGVSRWTFAKKVKLFVDSFIAFSYSPIRAVSAMGALLSVAAFGYAVFVVVARLLWGTPVQGFTTTVLLIAFTSGIQMLMLGVLGEYLWRTLDEVRQRPAYVLDRHWADESCHLPSTTPERSL